MHSEWRNMNIRRAIGIILLALGIAVIIFASYEKGHIAEAAKKANEQISEGKSFFQENPIGNAVGSVVGESMHHKVSTEVVKYQQMVMWLTIIGIIIAIIGLGMTLFCRSRKKS